MSWQRGFSGTLNVISAGTFSHDELAFLLKYTYGILICQDHQWLGFHCKFNMQILFAQYGCNNIFFYYENVLNSDFSNASYRLYKMYFLQVV